MSDVANDRDFGFRSDAYAWYVVFVLCLGSVISMLDRQIINLLVEPIKEDLKISDTQVSLLQGFAFAAFYTVMAIPLGRIADSRSRRGLIFWGVIVFSSATFVCGLARNFFALFFARMMVGAGEATLAPAGYSLIGDYFPRNKIGRAVGLFVGTSFAGTGLSLLLIGVILGTLAAQPDVVLPGIGPVADWQLAFIVAAVPSFLFAFLLLTVREPPRSEVNSLQKLHADKVPVREIVAFARSNFGLLGPIYIGLPLIAATNFAINAWVPSFFIRTYGWKPEEIGSSMGLMVMIFSTAGVVLGGWASDWLVAKGRADANLRVPMLASLAAIPFVLAFSLAGDAMLSLILLGPVLFFGAMPFGAGTALIPSLAPNRMRGQLMAVYLLLANLVGGGVGPWLVAVFTDYVAGDPLLIRYSLAVVGSILFALGAAAMAVGIRSFGRNRLVMSEAAAAA